MCQLQYVCHESFASCRESATPCATTPCHVPAFPPLPDFRSALDSLGQPDGLRRIVESAIVVLLAVQAARLAWLLLPPAALGVQPVDPGAITQAPSGRLATDAFYPGRGTGTAASADASGLRLFAVRPAPAGGSAIIAMRGEPQRSFPVGEEVAAGVTLAEVQADHVVLDSGGRRSELRFDNTDAHPPAIRATPARTAGPLGGAAPSVAPAADAPEPAVDPAQLVAQMGLVPEQADGRITGYTVIPRGDGSALRQAGLQAGDVLLSVNNEALDAERHAELASSLAGASSISLTYRRDGQIRSATLQAQTP